MCQFSHLSQRTAGCLSPVFSAPSFPPRQAFLSSPEEARGKPMVSRQSSFPSALKRDLEQTRSLRGSPSNFLSLFLSFFALPGGNLETKLILLFSEAPEASAFNFPFQIVVTRRFQGSGCSPGPVPRHAPGASRVGAFYCLSLV